MRYLAVILVLLLVGCTAEKSKNEAEKTHIAAPDAAQHSNVGEGAPEPVPTEFTPNEPVPTEITLGEASTPLLDNTPSRVENINTACGAVNGIALYPGGTFSFNDTVGRRTEERGYKEAKVIVDGHSEQGCGGGVCQVSSTLHMAAKAAGLEIVERHPHSKGVPYAPEGMDATVVSGEKDLRFSNNTDNVVVLFVWTDGESVFSKFTKKTS